MHNCEYCGQPIEDNLEKCPSCGAVNANYQRVSIEQPKTIEELKLWYKQMNLPAEEVTRFFIGKDYPGKKAYGIYKEPSNGKFIVYKNKADGSRAVRYSGNDEAYAVNEIFQKLREIIAVQKGMNVVDQRFGGSKSSYRSRKKKGISLKAYLLFILSIYLVGIIVGIPIAIKENRKNKVRDKYYQYEGEYYYNFGGKYYRYDEDSEEWSYYGYDAPFDETDYKDYEIDRSDNDLDDFHNSQAYQDWYDANDNYDSDSDNNWDSGWDSNDSWDSDYGSDWDSDW